ncbi:MAG: hypothetical protein ACXWUG_06420 [Polyangiales bacterium]
MRSSFFLASLALTAGCASSSSSFDTKYPADTGIARAERGAEKLGCEHRLSFHGEEFRCQDKSVILQENSGRFGATCVHLSRSECEELVDKLFEAGGPGS